MHIGIESTTLRSQLLGGVWRYTENLITAMGRLPSPHRYSLLYINAFKPWSRVPPVVVERPQSRLVEVTSVPNILFTFLAPIVTRRRPGLAVESFLGPVDVFHSVNAALLPQRHGRKVLTVHDLTCLSLPQFHPWRRRALFRLSIRRAIRQADAIIVPSQAAKGDLVTFFPWSECKIEVIPEAPGEQFMPLGPEQRQPVASRYGLTYGDFLLFVGNVEPRQEPGRTDRCVQHAAHSNAGGARAGDRRGARLEERADSPGGGPLAVRTRHSVPRLCARA